MGKNGLQSYPMRLSNLLLLRGDGSTQFLKLGVLVVTQSVDAA
jgi:hypothetical protein